MNVMEQMIDIPDQEVLTKDNCTVMVDAIAFFQVFDVAKASYEIVSLEPYLVQLTMSTIRSVMSALDLDQTLSHRDEINERLLRVVDAAGSPWGLKLNRIEIKDIIPPEDVLRLMSRQIIAKLERRIEMLTAQGQRQPSILRAHGASPELHVDRPRTPCVFIGHGRSKLWARMQLFMQDELQLKTVSYESESRVGLSIVPILEEMLGQATFAVLILTREDETAEGLWRTRQNVIHEAGLFQGHLGFQRVVMLVQSGLENFSNVAGLQYIEFQGDNIEQTFWEVQKALKREGLVMQNGSRA